MLITRNNIQDIVNATNTKPDKDYGQNFLIVPEICEDIVNSLCLNQDDKTLEIGPGLGSLTHFMYEKCNLTVCDIDSRMIMFLKGFYTNLEYIENDIRKTDVSKYNKIIGNLPYNITTELVIYLLINAQSCEKMILMCQQEAFNRFFDLSGGEYGPASILIHLLGTPKKLFTVKPGNFYPAPKCNSLVFSFEFSPEANKEEAVSIYKFAKALFTNRRKTIYNNLKNYLQNGERANNILEKLNISNMLRPEEISPSTYIKLYNACR